MENKKNICPECFWNNECYIQNSINSHFRHKKPLFKIDLTDFGCNLFESNVVKIEKDFKTLTELIQDETNNEII